MELIDEARSRAFGGGDAPYMANGPQPATNDLGYDYDSGVGDRLSRENPAA